MARKHPRTRYAMLALAIATCASTVYAQSRTVLERLIGSAVTLTAARQAPYAFDLDYETGNGQLRARFNRPETRLELSPARQLNAAQQAEFEALQRRMTGVPWCASALLGQVVDLAMLAEDERSITLGFQPTRESTADEVARRMAGRLRGEVVLSRADRDVMRIRIFLPQAFSPVPFGRIEHYSVATECAAAPNGRRYAAEVRSELRARFGGRLMESHAVRTIRNLRAVQ